MKPMDKKIIPLVDALNATGLFETFSSCEGHFPCPHNEPDNGSDYSTAFVLFRLTLGAREVDVEKFFLFIFHELDRRELRFGCWIGTSKQFFHTPDAEDLEPAYQIEIKPQSPCINDSEKRRSVDEGINALTDITTKYFRQLNMEIKNSISQSCNF